MDNLIYTALERYFNSLSKFGYKSYDEVYKLIALIFITELLNSDCKYFISEDDYKSIQKTLYCLYRSTCLIPLPEYIVDTFINCSGKINNN